MKHIPAIRFFQTLLLAGALLYSAGAAADRPSPFSRVVVFGDSLTDPGNAFALLGQVSLRPFELIPSAPYAIGGLHFSNGKTWVEQFGQRLRRGNSTCAALQSRGMCSNYAVGAARARLVGPFDLNSQVELFLGDFSGVAAADALYVVHIGGNDVRDAIVALQLDPSGATSQAIIGQALNTIADSIIMLSSAGAREFLVPNAPNFALVPAIRLQGPQAQAAAQALSAAFNNTLADVITGLEASLPLTIHPLDIQTLINDTVAMPKKVGLREVEQPCITPGVVVRAICRHPGDYLFWDGIHPTRAGHAIIAREAREVFAKPRRKRERWDWMERREHGG